MKFRDPETGEFKELYTKAADTLPVGTVVDYDGDEVPAGWEEVESPYQQIDGEVVKTGRKVFGKDEYVYTKTITSLDTLETGLTNIDYILNISCMVLDTVNTNGVWRPIPWCYNASTYDSSYIGGFNFNPVNGKMSFQVGSGITGYAGKGVVSIYFTYKD